MDKIYIKAEDLSKWCLRNFRVKKDLYSLDEILGLIDDMDDKISNLESKLGETEKDIEDNYKPVNPMHQCNVSESDFH